MAIIGIGRLATRQAVRAYGTSSPRILKTVHELRQWRLDKLRQSQSVGMVPTMGALHDGHLNLVQNSLQQNHSTVVSIFVNPSQFAPGEDLDNYPRTLDADLVLLRNEFDQKLKTTTDADFAVFLPSISEMYPTGITINRADQKGAFVEVKGLSEQLEGSIRPQFFRGVATVVAKLLNAAGIPDRAYFGQKDVQQSIVIKRMVQDLLIPSEIVVIPTVREPSGLAMSSRNEYLSPQGRQKASILYQAMCAGQKAYAACKGSASRQQVLDPIHKVLNTPDPEFPVEIEYIALSEKQSLEETDTVVKGQGAVISGAIRIPNKEGGITRIIDNIILD